jgi:hypothetical protein
MNTALLVGCGSKFGLELTQRLLNMGWTVFSISGSDISCPGNLHHLTIDWSTVNVAQLEKFLKVVPGLDLVFFNQNSSSLSSDNFTANSFKTAELWKQEKTWAQSYFVSCILPFHIIHTLGTRCSDTTKVGWMLSEYIYNHSDISYPDYIGNKYQNYLLMKSFSKNHNSCFFGVNPDNLSLNQNTDNLVGILTSSPCDLHSKVIKFDGSIDIHFEKFTN